MITDKKNHTDASAKANYDKQSNLSAKENSDKDFIVDNADNVIDDDAAAEDNGFFEDDSKDASLATAKDDEQTSDTTEKIIPVSPDVAQSINE